MDEQEHESLWRVARQIAERRDEEIEAVNRLRAQQYDPTAQTARAGAYQGAYILLHDWLEQHQPKRERQ